MDIEFHYYITAFLAKEAGFSKKESEVIGYCAQYIDDNDIIYKVKNKANGEIYKNYISQTFNILKPKKQLMRIYPIFHFVPGNPNAKTAKRKDNRIDLLNTTPNSEYANNIIDNAFKTPKYLRLHRIGIASHTYIDTWAHQNFVGWYSSFNHIKGDIKPNIGHADAEQHPDWVAHNWQDSRLTNINISNLERFNEAAKCLFNKYCLYQKKQNNIDNLYKWNHIYHELQELQGKEYSGYILQGRKERIKKYLQKMPWLDKYDDKKWFNQAINTKVRGFKDSNNGILKLFNLFKDKYYWQDNINIEESNWFKFQEAVKQHQFEAIKILEPRFLEAGLVNEKDF